MNTYVQTSQNIIVQFTPGARSHTLTKHRQVFIFDADVPNASTFKLWVSGKVTASITFSTTNATTQANIISALNTTTGLTWIAYATAAGTGPRYIYLECITASRWFKISVDTQPSTGKATVFLANAGKQVYSFNSALKSVTNQGNIEFTDVTPFMQFEEESLPTKEVLTSVIDLYDTFDALSPTTQWEYAVFVGQVGLLEVYEAGNIPGQRMSSMYFLIEDVQRPASNKAAREVRISGRRQGAMVKPFGTLIT